MIKTDEIQCLTSSVIRFIPTIRGSDNVVVQLRYLIAGAIILDDLHTPDTDRGDDVIESSPRFLMAIRPFVSDPSRGVHTQIRNPARIAAKLTISIDNHLLRNDTI